MIFQDECLLQGHAAGMGLDSEGLLTFTVFCPQACLIALEGEGLLLSLSIDFFTTTQDVYSNGMVALSPKRHRCAKMRLLKPPTKRGRHHEDYNSRH